MERWKEVFPVQNKEFISERILTSKVFGPTKAQTPRGTPKVWGGRAKMWGGGGWGCFFGFGKLKNGEPPAVPDPVEKVPPSPIKKRRAFPRGWRRGKENESK